MFHVLFMFSLVMFDVANYSAFAKDVSRENYFRKLEFVVRLGAAKLEVRRTAHEK